MRWAQKIEKHRRRAHNKKFTTAKHHSLLHFDNVVVESAQILLTSKRLVSSLSADNSSQHPKIFATFKSVAGYTSNLNKIFVWLTRVVLVVSVSQINFIATRLSNQQRNHTVPSLV